MGRKRLSDDGLPERVYAHRGGFIYRPKVGKAVVWPDYGTMIAEHARLSKAGIVTPSTRPARGATIGGLVDQYVLGEVWKLADETQRRYKPYLADIKAVLGDLAPERLKPKDIYAFIDGITQSPGSRNVIVSIFRTLFKIAIRKGLCDVNPAREVARDPTPGRERSPTLADLQVFKEQGGPWWACYIDFKLMTGLREKDMIEIPPLPLDEGLFEREVSKTKRWRATARRRVGRTIPFEINEEVRAVLRRLYALDRPQSTQVLFCNERGRPFKSSGFQTAWRRVMLRTAAEGVEWFHEHDIRATVANADPANAQKRLTHKNRTTTDAYLRKFRTEVVPALPMKMIEEREQAAEAAGNIHQLEMRKVK